MGQYYKAINLNNMHWLQSNNFIKLTESAWVGNDFVGIIMRLLSPGNKWHKSPVVWCGDYFDEDGEEDFYHNTVSTQKVDAQVSEKMGEIEQLKAILVNHTKKMYVVYKDMPEDNDKWMVNPLPILTALGNGRGGGDYYEEQPDFKKVGIWARDILSIEFSKPKGYKKLTVKFCERQTIKIDVR